MQEISGCAVFNENIFGITSMVLFADKPHHLKQWKITNGKLPVLLKEEDAIKHGRRIKSLQIQII